MQNALETEEKNYAKAKKTFCWIGINKDADHCSELVAYCSHMS